MAGCASAWLMRTSAPRCSPSGVASMRPCAESSALVSTSVSGCMGCSVPSAAAIPSIVVTGPRTIAASERQDSVALPSTIIVHAPHWPWSQPFFDPVRPIWVRTASSSVVRTIDRHVVLLPVHRQRHVHGPARVGRHCRLRCLRSNGRSRYEGHRDCGGRRAKQVTAAELKGGGFVWHNQGSLVGRRAALAKPVHRGRTWRLTVVF